MESKPYDPLDAQFELESRDPADDGFESAVDHGFMDSNALQGKISTPQVDIEAGNTPSAAQQAPADSSGFGLGGLLGSAMGSAAAQAAAQGAAQGAFETTKSTFTSLTSLDSLKPYFDVTTQQVTAKLMYSIVPTKAHLIVEEPDLYAPLMIVLTMSAILIAEMKEAETSVAQDATLIGTALGMCGTYWVVSSLFFYFLGYLFDTAMTVLQVLCIMGYALFGFTLLLAFQQIVGHSWLVHFGTLGIVALSCATLGLTFYKRASIPSQGLFAACIVMGTQFLFLGYVTVRYVGLS